MIIYKITNKVNGKIYIGKTKNKLNSRWNGHKTTALTRKTDTCISRSIRKYGVDNFEIIQIDTATTLSELKRKEYYWIKHYNSTDKNIGYNIQYGDAEDNMIISEDTKVKLVESIKRNKINGCLKKGSSIMKTVYIGVHYLMEKRLWSYSITFNGKKICQKRYETDKYAAIGRDIKLLELFNESIAIQLMNFPENLEQYKSGTIKDTQRPLLIPKRKSKYKGALYEKFVDRWTAAIIYKQKKYKKGTFALEEEAAEMADYIRLTNNIGGELNFPNIDYLSTAYTPPKTMEEKFQYPKYISSYVSTNGKTRYRVRNKPKRISKLFDTFEDALEFQKTIL